MALLIVFSPMILIVVVFLQDIAQKYEIEAMPTLILFRNGKEVRCIYNKLELFS